MVKKPLVKVEEEEVQHSKPNKTMVVTNTSLSYPKTLFAYTAIGCTAGTTMGFSLGYHEKYYGNELSVPSKYWPKHKPINTPMQSGLLSARYYGPRMGIWFGLTHSLVYAIGKIREKEVEVDDVWTHALCAGAAAGCTFIGLGPLMAAVNAVKYGGVNFGIRSIVARFEKERETTSKSH